VAEAVNYIAIIIFFQPYFVIKFYFLVSFFPVFICGAYM
jgi:hypothetical protein